MEPNDPAGKIVWQHQMPRGKVMIDDSAARVYRFIPKPQRKM
jgi:hypothetical protein